MEFDARYFFPQLPGNMLIQSFIHGRESNYLRRDKTGVEAKIASSPLLRVLPVSDELRNTLVIRFRCMLPRRP